MLHSGAPFLHGNGALIPEKCWEEFRAFFAQSFANSGVCKMERKDLTLKQKKSLSGYIFCWLNTSSMWSVYVEAKK